MPSRGDWTKIRGIFIPDTGNKFITCDYSQLEVTIAAHFSQDKNLLKIVFEGASQHDITAEGLGVERSLAKSINFAMQYGAGVDKIRSILQCTKKEAELALNKYWETYSGLKKLIDACHKKVDLGEPIINPFGRVRHFDKVDNRPKWDKAYRQAFNSLIQGTGADICHTAYYRLNKELSRLNIGRTVFEVHDEIVISAKDGHYEQATELLKTNMVSVGNDIKLTVPLSVEASEPLDRWEK
jgi:DNA polymerase-1